MTKLEKTIKIFLIVILSYFGIRFGANLILIAMYNNQTYTPLFAKVFTYISLDQAYISHYNHGNTKYKRFEYEEAIDSYLKSLEKKPPRKKVCDVRINLALATIYNIDATNKKETKEQLILARSYLYEDDCAHEQDDNGYSPEAEKLEEEINELLEELEDGGDGGDEDQEDTDGESDEDDNEDGENEEIDPIEDELEENKKEARKERDRKTGFYENADDYQYYNGKTW